MLTNLLHPFAPTGITFGMNTFTMTRDSCLIDDIDLDLSGWSKDDLLRIGLGSLAAADQQLAGALQQLYRDRRGDASAIVAELAAALEAWSRK